MHVYSAQYTLDIPPHQQLLTQKKVFFPVADNSESIHIIRTWSALALLRAVRPAINRQGYLSPEYELQAKETAASGELVARKDM